MRGKDINQVLAENLTAAMDRQKLTQTKVGQMTGMGQTTVSLYQRPGERKAGKSGKVPSGKLSELQALAEALGFEPWELLKPPGVVVTGLDWRKVAFDEAEAMRDSEAREWLYLFLGRVDERLKSLQALQAAAPQKLPR